MSSRPRKKRGSRSKRPGGLPKGGYQLPEGGVMLPPSSVRRGGKDQVVVRAVLRDDPDLKQLARALLELARKDLDENRTNKK